MMKDTIEINSEFYTKINQTYTKQCDIVLSCLGETMQNALIKAKAFIAGGAVLSAFTGGEINDVDVYFQSKESMAQAFLEVTKDWETVYIGHTEKSITLKDRDTEATVQFIYFDYFATPQDVFQCFDFTVCMASLKMEDFTFSFNESFIGDMASRILNFNPNTRFPYISLLRTKKYQEKGYKISRGAMLAIATACSYCPITTWNEAKYQLGGVYGNEIDLEIQQDNEFSPESFYKILKTIPETRTYITTNDYEQIFYELLGINYDDYQKNENKPTPKPSDLF